MIGMGVEPVNPYTRGSASHAVVGMDGGTIGSPFFR